MLCKNLFFCKFLQIEDCYLDLAPNRPPPSEGIINDMVDEFKGVILGVLIGVPVFAAGMILRSAINSGGNGDS